MMPVPAWLTKTVAQILGVVAIVLVIGALLFLHQCSQERTAKVETKVAAGQAGAAQASGADAVNTIGNVMGNEQAAATITQENGNAIDNAKGSTVTVYPAVRSAGFASLCRRASYRSAHPACVQHPATH